MMCDIYTQLKDGILTNVRVEEFRGMPYYIDANGKVTDDKENGIIQYCPIQQTKLFYCDVNNEIKQQENSFDKKLYVDMDELKRNIMEGKIDIPLENVITFNGEKITITASGF